MQAKDNGKPYISPKLQVDKLIADTTNFQRLSCYSAVDKLTNTCLQQIVQEEVVGNGMPIVITGCNQREGWPAIKFNPEWLTKHHGHNREFRVFLVKQVRKSPILKIEISNGKSNLQFFFGYSLQASTYVMSTRL
jgi:hypothetical protein